MKTLYEHERDARRQYLIEALAEARGSVVDAARIAGICRAQFYKLMAEFGLPRASRFIEKRLPDSRAFN